MAPSEETLRQAAAGCFDNARALYEEAGLLYENGKFARASALAVIAAEEFAKSIIYLVAALMPDQRPMLPAKLDGHEMKHRVADAADAAEMMNEDYWAVLSQEDGPTWKYRRLTDMMVLLCRWGLSSLVDKKEAAAHFKALRARHKKELSEHAPLLDPVYAGKDIFLSLREPDLKNAALYVDLDDDTVKSPESMNDRDARVTIAGIEYFLATYHALPDATKDDAAWSSFAAEVRRRA